MVIGEICLFASIEVQSAEFTLRIDLIEWFYISSGASGEPNRTYETDTLQVKSGISSG